MARRRAKQGHLDGVALSKEESDAKDNLIGKMKEHKRDRYETPDMIVSLTHSSNVKVKPKKEEEGDAEE